MHSGNEIQLSQRLHTIANHIPAQSTVADIGGDHAYLLLAAAAAGKVKRGIVGEVSRGPYENALGRVQALCKNDLIDVRLGDGLEVISPGEVEVITIAGMGGALIAKILQQGEEKLERVQRLILQPNNASEAVRSWLLEHGWRVVDEDLIEEADILYEIIVAERGNGKEQYEHHQLSQKQLMILGPCLWQQSHPKLVLRLQGLIAENERILEQLQRGKSAEAEARAHDIRTQLSTWRSVKAWYGEERT
ncbi:class I SAM-dependent methyltransferase [Mechercharimyces sp. CAU 1602]|uniref:tRNA (adenine(22)-N(1))-methyltransferase n=1 Tax=Mechercharimyces sp. CAU 1602 TaxID=2973933 RepID=UPI00216161A0|nr:class I SAM-dependent methyltransferase [Mechercharimyces sp. CAU 1602]MCS1350495.1 class I SAM-dependent methyltransferase [Mechercharimyces sp. CAU 1602]